VSPDVSASQRKRLEEAGWELVEFRSGKSLWRRPEGGRLYTLKSALKYVNRQERSELEAAGWEAVEGGREMFWCRPDSGYLYAQEAAIEIVRRMDKGGAN
jgi:hypothetical protein